MTHTQKKTLVLGATPDASRYANMAVQSLVRHGVEAVPVGIRRGEIAGLDILLGQPQVPDIHTVTLYLGEARQQEYMDYVLALRPQRIIFNPGAENPALARRAREQGIETVEGCTLVMLSIGTF